MSEKHCCSASHNLDIVTNNYNNVRAENDRMRAEIEALKRFQRLVWALVGERDYVKSLLGGAR